MPNRFFAIVMVMGALLASSLATSFIYAREKWPAEPAERKQQEEQARKEADARWEAAQPQLEEWAKKGKPFIPWAAKPSDLPQAGIPAFPGAEGGGMYTFGGRGGKVYVVTSLEDSGPGTFREACEAIGPRIVVFNVAGVIHLKNTLDIRAPYITIAGQTAPGDGVCIAGASTWLDTHDVVVRYMRFRRGETDVFSRDDALGGNPVGNIMVDHCSCSWGLDENVSMYRHMYQPPTGGKELKLPTVNITIQWGISYEALNPYNHAFGGTWSGTNDTFHHNLFASNTGRNPSIGLGGDFNFINNVLFNWRHRTLDGGDDTSRVNCINNVYKPGPMTPDAPIRYRVGEPQPQRGKHDEVKFGKWYVVGNVVTDNPKVTADNWDGGIQFPEAHVSEDADPTTQAAEVQASATTKPSTGKPLKELLRNVRVNKPFPMSPVTIQPAQEAYEAVLNGAGATLPKRDPVDLRAIEETRTGKVQYEEGKGIITDIKQVGGYPEYHGEPVVYTQNDGIPDWWKDKYHLDKADPELASKDSNGDGYTNIEKYLDGIDPTKNVDWKDLKNNVNPLGGGESLQPVAQNR